VYFFEISVIKRSSCYELSGGRSMRRNERAVEGMGFRAPCPNSAGRARRNFLPQVRSFGRHRDRVTGIDRVFAGQDARGVFSGTYDPTIPGRIRWSAVPELDLSSVSSAGISGRNGYLRVSSFAECNGQLYTTVGQHIYERIDGAEPHWRLVYTNSYPGHSETGLRGMTAIPDPSAMTRSCSLPSRATRRGSYASIRATAARPRSSISRIFSASTGGCRPAT
jgi:hypothetical protein